MRVNTIYNAQVSASNREITRPSLMSETDTGTFKTCLDQRVLPSQQVWWLENDLEFSTTLIGFTGRFAGTMVNQCIAVRDSRSIRCSFPG
jgi:hypothetical protein